jgi:hypothetical protein
MNAVQSFVTGFAYSLCGSSSMTIRSKTVEASPFKRMRLTNCTVYDARYFRAAQALGVSSATRLNGKSAKPGSTEAR